jgi:hypothetical protein
MKKISLLALSLVSVLGVSTHATADHQAGHVEETVYLLDVATRGTVIFGEFDNGDGRTYYRAVDITHERASIPEQPPDPIQPPDPCDNLRVVWNRHFDASQDSRAGRFNAFTAVLRAGARMGCPVTLTVDNTAEPSTDALAIRFGD